MNSLKPEALVEEFNRKARAKLASNHKDKRLSIVGQDVSEGNKFLSRLAAENLELKKSAIEILQINLGKLCNLTCHHCHVEAGPNRKEIITKESIAQLVKLAAKLSVHTVDLTGGAPEMCPGFKDYVREFRKLNCKVIVRSNLTILVEKGYEDFIDFFKGEKVSVVASLPCYTVDNVDAQRGEGVFDDSIKALQELNKAGYGVSGTGLTLDLVYNPGGPSLPGSQEKLERDYKRVLEEKFSVVFNKLICITNLPIGRFYTDLKKEGKAESYDELLRDNFNRQTVQNLMCKNTLNISYDGWVYDCDFNQMLELPMRYHGKPVHICDDEAVVNLLGSDIATGDHCFGCTAGAGSSCGGQLG